MTLDPNNSGEGGSIEIPNDTAPFKRSRSLQVGDIVSPIDRNNLGKIVRVLPTKVLIHFVNKQTGAEEQCYFAPETVRVIKSHTSLREIRFIGLKELFALESPPWAIEGVLRQGEFAVLFGPPATGKSFVTLSMALCIAAGVPWNAKVTVSGPIVYIAAEGGRGLGKRIRAWIQNYPESSVEKLNDVFHVYPDGVAFLEDSFDELLDRLNELPARPVLVVIDTLARCLVGGDENDAGDMGRFVANCDRIRKEIGAAVLVLHHTTKDNTSRERGSGALQGAADVMMLVTKDGNNLTLSCVKQKEDRNFDPIEFEMEVVPLPKNKYDEAESSCVLRFKNASKQCNDSNRDLNQQQILILKSIFESSPDEGITVSRLAKMIGKSESNLYYYLNPLKDKGYVKAIPSKRSTYYQLTELGHEFAMQRFKKL